MEFNYFIDESLNVTISKNIQQIPSFINALQSLNKMDDDIKIETIASKYLFSYNRIIYILTLLSSLPYLGYFDIHCHDGSVDYVLAFYIRRSSSNLNSCRS